MPDTAAPLTPDEDPINDTAMPLLAHLTELRTRLLWSIVAFLACFFLCYYFSRNIYSFLAQPLADILIHQGANRRLIYTALYEAFFTYIKVAMFGAAFLSFPVIATQVYMFVAPGLYRSEKRAFLPFLLATPVLFVGGAALAYYLVFPAAWSFFLSFESPDGAGGLPVQLEAKVSEYLGLVMKMIFAFGLAFQLPVLLTLLARVGIVSSAALKKYRRYAYVGMFMIAAIITPPDPLSMTSLAIPLIALYEISILTARWIEPKVAVDA